MSTQHVIQSGIRRLGLNEQTDLSIDTFITAWANRVVTNGGLIPSTNTQVALTTFYKSLVDNNLFNKMMSVNCFVPDNLIAAITPLIGVGYNPWTNVNFVSGDLSVNGLIGNGSSKYLNTGLATNLFTYTNMGVTVYTTDVSANNTSTLFGSTSVAGAKQLFQFLPRNSGNLTCDFPIENAVACRITGANTTGGYFCVSRTASNRVDLYKANSSIGHTTFGTNTNTTGNYLSTYTWFVQAVNNVGSAVQYSSLPISFCAFHASVTAAQSEIFYNLIQTLRQNLGGGYI